MYHRTRLQPGFSPPRKLQSGKKQGSVRTADHPGIVRIPGVCGNSRHQSQVIFGGALEDAAWTRIAARTIPYAPFAGSAAVHLAVRDRSGSGRGDPRCKGLHLTGGTFSHTFNRSDTRWQDCSFRQQPSHSCGDTCFAVQWLRGVCRVLEFACSLHRSAMGWRGEPPRRGIDS